MSRFSMQHAVWMLAAGLAITLLGGCQNSQWQRTGWSQPYPRDTTERRSLALDSPRLARLERGEDQGGDSDELPWYLYRRDMLPATYNGYVSPTYEQSVTYTYDNQSAYGRHVYDWYNSTTYRVGAAQSVR